MSRDSPRDSFEVTSAICSPDLISENITCSGVVQTRPEALGSHRSASPANTGTTHVSQLNPTSLVYAMREPSGEKTGPIFGRLSWVSWTGSPEGRLLT